MTNLNTKSRLLISVILIASTLGAIVYAQGADLTLDAIDGIYNALWLNGTYSGISNTIYVDTLEEFSLASGLTIDAVLIKDGKIDTGPGLTEVHLMDQDLQTSDSPLFVDLNASNIIYVDTLTEFSPGAGITIDSILVNDSSIVFPPNGMMPHMEGRLGYDQSEGALIFDNNESDVRLQIGQESWLRVINEVGSTIEDGEAVYISGASGGIPQIDLAQSNGVPATLAIGLATHDIENGTIGYVTINGLVRGVNTSLFSDGDILFLSAITPGFLTTSQPSDPNFRVQIGYVALSNDSGKIYVDVDIFGDVTSIRNAVGATSAFGSDNILIRSDGTGKSVQSTGITIDDLNNMTGVSTIDTGQGANELYAMDQDIETGDSPTFVNLTLIGIIDTGQGPTEVYLMDQDLQTGDSPTFAGLTAGVTTLSTNYAEMRKATTNYILRTVGTSGYVQLGLYDLSDETAPQIQMWTTNTGTPTIGLGDGSGAADVHISRQAANQLLINDQLSLGGLLDANVGADIEGQVAINDGTTPLAVIRNIPSGGSVMYSILELTIDKPTSMNDGFGSSIDFYIEDDGAGPNKVGRVGVIRDGDDDSGAMVFFTDDATALALTLEPDTTAEFAGNIIPDTNNTGSVGEDGVRFADGYFVTVTAKNTVTGKIIENEIKANPLESFEEGDLVQILDTSYFTKTTNKLANVIGVVTLNPGNIQTGTETVTAWVDEIHDVTRSVSWVENVTDAYGQVYEVERIREKPVIEWYLEMIEETLSDGNTVLYYENRTRIKTYTVQVEVTAEIPVMGPKNEPVLCVFGGPTLVKISEPVLKHDVLVASAVDGEARPLRTVLPELVEQFGDMEMNFENVLMAIEKLNYKTLGRVMEDSTGVTCWAMIGY